MDWLNILDRYGLPVVGSIAMAFYIWKSTKFIQDELTRELRESFGRLEGILVKLIDQQKKMQLEQKGIENSYKTLVEVIAKLSGNGLRDKFLRMQEKNENKKYWYGIIVVMIKLILFGIGFMLFFYGGLYLITKGILEEDDFR